jgi:hypothetical protein
MPEHAKIILGDNEPDLRDDLEKLLPLRGHEIILYFYNHAGGMIDMDKAIQGGANLAIFDRSILSDDDDVGKPLQNMLKEAKIPLIVYTAYAPPDWMHEQRQRGITIVQKNQRAGELFQAIKIS